MTDLEKAREFFSNDLYATAQTGAVIDEVKKGYAKCSLKLERHHRNAVGGVMGGVMFTLADFVFAVASNFDSDCVTVSVVSQISFLSSPKGERLIGESRLIKDGRSNCFYEITVSDENGKPAAVVSITGAHLIR